LGAAEPATRATATLNTTRLTSTTVITLATKDLAAILERSSAGTHVP